ncbi:MAG TPA: glycosyl hydrolase, partial [Phnomibacter sp.]|nr:glycosyl hydrolase [Phnomibacter sp.]
ARGQSNWTPQFLQEFENRRGYDLRLWLPQLLQPNGSLTHKRVLFDYRQTIADLILENFTQPWANWAHQKGALVRNQSHGSPGNTMDLYAAVDIPETEGTELMRFKFATSTAHVAGKKLVAAEAATWLGDHFESTLGQVKRLIDLYFLGGVNHIVFHGTNYSPAHAAWPGWLFYAAVHFHPNNPFWQHLPALNAYIDRCQRFLQAGKPDNDVLIYYPYADAQMEPGRDLLKHYDAMRPEFNNTPFADIADRMQKQGYTFDFISDKQVLGVTTQDGELLTGGTRYKAIMLPANQYIPLGTMEYLISLVNKGATLLVYRQMPANVPGLANYKADSAALKQLINTIRFTQNGEVYKASLGKGTIWMSQQETALLEDAGIRKEAMAAYGLQTIRRRINGGTAYFIVNTGSRVVDTLIPLQVPDKHAVLFNPMNGQVGLAKYKASPDKPLLVHVQLQPAETVIVQTYAAKPVANPYTYFRVSGNAWPLHTTWKVQFLQGGPVLPPAHTTRHLTSFTTWGQPYAAFSGLAAYTARFKKPAQAADAYLLNIEQVGSQVQVFINNKALATIIDTPYQVIIPASLLKPVNTLRLEVTNSMANRIIDMEQKGEAYKIFYNTNFPAKLAVNRGPDGLFTAKHWPPFASGIMGQVSLTPLQKF